MRRSSVPVALAGLQEYGHGREERQDERISRKADRQMGGRIISVTMCQTFSKIALFDTLKHRRPFGYAGPAGILQRSGIEARIGGNEGEGEKMG